MRNLTRKIATWFLVAVVLAIIITVLSEFFIEVAKDKGFYDNAGKRWDRVMGAVADLVTTGYVLYPVTALSGLVAGVWLHHWAGKWDAKRKTPHPWDRAAYVDPITKSRLAEISATKSIEVAEEAVRIAQLTVGHESSAEDVRTALERLATKASLLEGEPNFRFAWRRFHFHVTAWTQGKAQLERISGKKPFELLSPLMANQMSAKEFASAISFCVMSKPFSPETLNARVAEFHQMADRVFPVDR
ncbi:hypothetical protein [Fulvimarina sp. MAC8]|uniref:hypothetical protein n=1 Tax=Fulvimarina sp. MAC8 TaxID=3162874 RepID=UPI0032EED20D